MNAVPMNETPSTDPPAMAAAAPPFDANTATVLASQQALASAIHTAHLTSRPLQPDDVPAATRRNPRLALRLSRRLSRGGRAREAICVLRACLGSVEDADADAGAAAAPPLMSRERVAALFDCQLEVERLEGEEAGRAAEGIKRMRLSGGDEDAGVEETGKEKEKEKEKEREMGEEKKTDKDQGQEI